MEISDLLGHGKLGEKLLEVLEKTGCGFLAPWQKKRLGDADRYNQLEDAKVRREVALMDAQTDVDVEKTKTLGYQELSTKVLGQEVNKFLPAFTPEQKQQLTQSLGGRALLELAATEVRQQHNKESILTQALLQAPDEVNDDPVDPDWMQFFLSECRDISNEQMQAVWARLLAGELAKPGSFRRQTLHLVKTMERGDAELIAFACSFSLRSVDNPGHLRIIKQGFTLGVDLAFPPEHMHPIMNQLESLGLFHSNQYILGDDHRHHFQYGDSTFTVQWDKKKRPRGPFILICHATPTGQELLSICDTHPVPGYLEALIGWLREKGYNVMVN